MLSTISRLLCLPGTLNPPTSYDKAVLAYGIFGIISLLQSELAHYNQGPLSTMKVNTDRRVLYR